MIDMGVISRAQEAGCRKKIFSLGLGVLLAVLTYAHTAVFNNSVVSTQSFVAQTQFAYYCQIMHTFDSWPWMFLAVKVRWVRKRRLGPDCKQSGHNVCVGCCLPCAQSVSLPMPDLYSIP